MSATGSRVQNPLGLLHIFPVYEFLKNDYRTILNFIFWNCDYIFNMMHLIFHPHWMLYQGAPYYPVWIYLFRKFQEWVAVMVWRWFSSFGLFSANCLVLLINVFHLTACCIYIYIRHIVQTDFLNKKNALLSNYLNLCYCYSNMINIEYFPK